jgi:hypothetical protein
MSSASVADRKYKREIGIILGKTPIRPTNQILRKKIFAIEQTFAK